MILLIDYGESSAKTLLIFNNGKPPFVYEVPLGFSAYTNLSIVEGVRFIIGETAKAAGVELLDAEKVKVPTYIIGGVASTKLKELLAAEPFDPAVVLARAPLPLVSVGGGLCSVLGKTFRGVVAAEGVAPWLPFRASLVQVENFLANEGLFEQVIPATPRDLSLKQAIARETVRAAWGEGGELPEEVIATGAVFAKAPRLEQVVLMLLDSLQPEGLLRVKVDRAQVMPVLALLQTVSAETFKSVLPLLPEPVFAGTTLSLNGGAELKIETAAGGPQEMRVEEESLVLLPLAKGEEARLTVGQGRAEKVFQVEGGEVGVVIDGRRRPLNLPERAKDRSALLKRWDREINAHGQVGEIK